MSVGDNTQATSEDLNALKNGRLLNPRERVLLRNNDRLEIGPGVSSGRLIQE